MKLPYHNFIVYFILCTRYLKVSYFVQNKFYINYFKYQIKPLSYKCFNHGLCSIPPISEKEQIIKDKHII